MSLEEIDELYDEYEERFGEKPLFCYPSSPYSSVYVKLVKKALKRGEPYTEEEMFKALHLEEEELI